MRCGLLLEFDVGLGFFFTMSPQAARNAEENFQKAQMYLRDQVSRVD